MMAAVADAAVTATPDRGSDPHAEFAVAAAASWPDMLRRVCAPRPSGC